jgi:hypothetical protein
MNSNQKLLQNLKYHFYIVFQIKSIQDKKDESTIWQMGLYSQLFQQ